MLLAMGCPKEAPKKLTFAPFRAPSGVPDPETIRDEGIDQPGRVGIETVLVVPATIEWEQLSRLLDSIGRQARAREGFKHAAHAQFVDVRIYDHVEDTSNANSWLGRLQIQGDKEPVAENRLPFPLEKKVQELIAKRPEYGSIKPTAEAQDVEGHLTVRVPYVVEGEDRYRKQVDFGSAIQEFDSWALLLFRKFPALREFAFIGEHQGKDLVKIRITRAQYDDINIAKVEEDLGAFSGEFLVGQMQGAISDQKVAAKFAKKQCELYGAMLARLPKDQIAIAASLK